VQQTFRFKDIPEGCLPSLFRGFSAPVIIETDFTAKELAFLMANDSDEFNRWDASQQLYFMELDAIIQAIQKQEPPSVSSHIVAAFKKALCDSMSSDPESSSASLPRIDRALVAKAVTLPDESEIAQKYEPVDVDAIHAARSFLEKSLAQNCEAELKKIIDICSKADPDDLSHAAMADRSLKNSALSYIGSLDTKESHQIILSHYNGAMNMTDEIASLSILCNEGGCDKEVMEQALVKFRDRWKDYPLVMDKWFSVQAGSTRPDTLDRIKRIVEYPEFSWKNPNRVRSVLSVLGLSNPVTFHRKDGEGYAFFADRVIELDKINSQIAARMVSIFSRWKKYDTARQEIMKTKLEQMVSLPDLSRDVYEIVSRALE
ncbi:MAG: aminopeptidase N C-terminal domain-containing protein, partial [Desulfamplus sp.]|nr:aminopeptidase N C-terminal domain-containing protein [Desulfamplus sp.]